MSTSIQPQTPTPAKGPRISLEVRAVADVQDALLVVMNDLKRLEGLFDHATANLLDRFSAATQAMHTLSDIKMAPDAEIPLQELRTALHSAVTELQFHDMATQLLVHTGKAIQGCAYQLAEQAIIPDEDEIGKVPPSIPQRPNPVTQSEMDAGSIELF